MKILDGTALENLRQKGLQKLLPDVPKISVGMGTCGIGNGAKEVYESLQNAIKAKHAKIQLVHHRMFRILCRGTARQLLLAGNAACHSTQGYTERRRQNCREPLSKGKMPVKKALCKIDKWNFFTSGIEFGTGLSNVPLWNEIPFFKGQRKIVLREAGLINPEDIEEYIAVGGYSALMKALTKMTSRFRAR